MSKLNSILKGWSNYLFHSEEVEVVARQRAEICSGCDLAVLGSYETMMPDSSIKKIKGMKCSECGCPLSTKLRSLEEKCGVGKWDSTK